MASFLRGGYMGPPTMPPPGTTGISPTATPIDFNFTGGGGGGGRKSHPDRQQQQAPSPPIAGGAVPIDTGGDPGMGGWADAARRAAAGITNAQQVANPLAGSAAATSNLGGMFGMGTPPAAPTPATPATPPPSVSGTPAPGGGPPMRYFPTSGQPFGTMRSYQTGTPFVPQTGPAMLHRGEQVVPAGQNPMNQQQQSPLAGVGNRLPPGLIQALLAQMPQGGRMQQQGGGGIPPQIMQALARLMQGGGGRM